MEFEPNQIVTYDDIKSANSKELDRLRYRCQTDLFFLANNILRNAKRPPLLQKVHGNICNTLIRKYPVSNFGYAGEVPGEIKPIFDWSPVKERVILSSRGTVKSVLEAVDVVQIILCEPDVRITLMSGKLGAAKSILRMSRSYFESNHVLGYLFPQWCDNININANEFTSPARKDYELRDPTLQVATFGSVKAGARAEYIKLDDATNEINQATPELVAKSIESYDDLDPIIEPGGYIDFTGTRWAVDDLPEYIVRKGEETEEEFGEKQVIRLFQPIWKVKKVEDDGTKSPLQLAKLQTERDEREKKNRLVPDDVELLWPEKLTARYLWPKYRKNPRKFACQYLLNPEAVTSGAFTRQLLLKATKGIEFCPLPHISSTFINWDLAGISGKGDFAVGVVGIWEHTGRLFIVDAIIEKFNSSTAICHAIINLFKKYNPDYHRIESANGAQLLSGELLNVAKSAKLDRAFHPGFDAPTHEKDAKIMRIRQLAGAMERGLLQIYEHIDCIEELYKQFEKFTGDEKYNDDGPDSIAQLYQKYKDSIGPKAVSYLTPSGAVVDFMSDGPNINDANFDREKEVDPHANERLYGDIEFLAGFTVPHT